MSDELAVGRCRLGDKYVQKPEKPDFALLRLSVMSEQFYTDLVRKESYFVKRFVGSIVAINMDMEIMSIWTMNEFLLLFSDISWISPGYSV